MGRTESEHGTHARRAMEEAERGVRRADGRRPQLTRREALLALALQSEAPAATASGRLAQSNPGAPSALRPQPSALRPAPTALRAPRSALRAPPCALCPLCAALCPPPCAPCSLISACRLPAQNLFLI